MLCPIESTEHDFVEPPKNTHKKKTEKDREKERQEREAAQKAADYYRKKQEELHRPVNPREPLKRTTDNNWVHVTCAVWAPEVKFGNAKALSPSEGIPSIPRSRYDEVCKICKQKGGACISCHQCKAPVHVGCAHQAGYLLGFEIIPIKVSRRDQFHIVTINGETGAMAAAIWCKEHIPVRTMVHRMHDMVSQGESQTKDPSGLNALQLFVQNFKQADLALTGTVRKANLIAMAVNMKNPLAASAIGGHRRASTTTITPAVLGLGATRAPSAEHQAESTLATAKHGDRVCSTCGIDVSPKWWPIDKDHEKALTNGHHGSIGSEAQKFVDQRNFQCHKCKKADRRPTPRGPAHRPPGAIVEAMSVMDPVRTAVAPPAPAPPPPAAAPVLATPLTSPPPNGESRPPPPPLAPFSWSSTAPSGPPSLSAAVPVAPPAIQAPPAGPPPPPPPPLSMNATAHMGPSPMAAPIAQPAPHPYAPQATSYGDWHRSAPQHSPPGHSMNGGPGGPSPLHNLRPPPITPVAHHQVPSLHHGGMAQPVPNGIPPPSPRRTAAIPSGPVPYLPAYHHAAPHALPNLTNGGPPPRAGEHAFSQGLLGQRSPFSTPHGSPPVSRDSLVMSREPSLSSNNLPPRQSDGRSGGGASASPSLRNLLS